MELRLLGNVEAWVDGTRLGVGHARQQCVLVVLLVEANRVVTVQQVIDRVWADDPPHRARDVVGSYFSRLRKVLAVGDHPVTIRRRSPGYVLEVDEGAVDLHRFRELVRLARSRSDAHEAVALLEQAGRLWRGQPCAGLDTPWINAVREELERERFAADADRIDLRLRLGAHAEVLPELTVRAQAHPLDERVAGQLMLALHRGGRQAEALFHYDRLRSRLADELGADPGAPLRRLHQQILTDAEEIASPPSAPPQSSAEGLSAEGLSAEGLSADGSSADGSSADGSSADGSSGNDGADPVVTPRQLPAPPEPFIGRHDELEQLDLAAHGSSTAVVVCAVAGVGGVGKTWLAVTWAHRHLDRFPDGQLFVDLRGFSPDARPMEPAVAVRGFLDALGVPTDRIPVDAHAQAALFRSLVVDKRLLIVLDNAATTDQVTPLLPGGGTCTVLITSRHKLPGLITANGAHHVPLGMLGEQESRALLTRRLGAHRTTAEPAATSDLIRSCGGLPLALGIVAAHARTRPGTSLAHLAEELRDSGLAALDDDDPMASLPTVLSWSLRALTPEQRQVVALLGVVPGPDTDLHAVANLVGHSLTRTRALLRGLEDACLLDRDARGRYRMHDLVRDFAASLAHRDLSEPLRRAALRRLVEFYLHTAHTADRRLGSHRSDRLPDLPEPTCRHGLPDLPAALAWFEVEHLCLLAALRTAIAQEWHQVAWHLVRNLSTFLIRGGHRRDHLAAWQAGLVAAEHLDDPALRATAHRRLGNCHADLWRHDEAIAHMEQALALTGQHGDRANEAATRLMFARTWQVWSFQLPPAEQGEAFRHALGHATDALALFRALDDPVGEATALNTVSWCAARLGDHDEARDHCRAALALYRRHPDPDGEANAWDTMGYIAHRTGRHHDAIDCYRRALGLLGDLGHTYQVAAIRDRLGDPHAALGRHEQARDLWQAALRVYRAQHHHAAADRVQRQLDALGDVPRS
ncbi:BTAD domain-containing putative transcriptional regulator [Actinosynnema sp. NPDC050801]|uniref:AfsR/SARP family transcriptional regulator n=1 Tax=unclassified Actinosynnema TaxID=2637065 RepID=UPI0033D9ED6D